MNTKKPKALLMMFLIVTTTFTISSLASPVQAAQKCCQKTTTGDYCQYADESECDPNFKSASALCENTNFCQLGCCIDDQEGICHANAPRTLCEARGGTFTLDPACNIPQCEKGCCTLGNECSFVTQTRCIAATSEFTGLAVDFDADVTSELECINQCRSEEKGCCVTEDACTYTSRAACSLTTVTNETGFFSGTFCSDSSLACNCAPRSFKGCLADQDDVYWFDSCGNPEGIAEACDYASGTLCGQDDSGDYSCLSTACEATYQEPSSPNSGGTKKSGESWCLYDASAGFGTDVVGSRHYRSLCVNGEEIVEPCRDYREEFCISGDVEFDSSNQVNNPFNPGSGTFIESTCAENRWQDCNTCNADLECGGECDQFEGEAKKACCQIKCCENTELRDCTWLGAQDLTPAESAINILGTKDDSVILGSCVPQVPPGFRFWEEQGTDVCSRANLECTVKFQTGGGSRFFGPAGELLGSKKDECIENCDCLKDDWVVGANNYCKALGDCGAYFNILGDASTDGFSNNQRELTIADIGDWSNVAQGGHPLGEEDKPTWKKYALIGGGLYVALNYAIKKQLAGAQVVKDFVFAGPRGIKAFFIRDTKTTDAMTRAAAQSFGTRTFTGGDVIPKGTFFEKEALTTGLRQGQTEEFVQKGFLKESGNGYITQTEIPVAEGVQIEGQVSATGATVAQWISTALWIYTIYKIIDVIGTKTEEITYTATCNPWVAPEGGSRCEECNNRAVHNGEILKPCTEYACESLGQNCELLNQGTGEEACVYLNQYDTNSPVIKPWQDVLSEGYSLILSDNGYTIQPDIQPFATLTFGIQTNEPAQCKVTDKIGAAYDDIQTFFGASFYKDKHELTIVIPKEATEESALQVTNGGQYAFNIRCQDGNGNANNRDYVIKFNVKAGPDLTVPSIEGSSIPNGAFIPHGLKEETISIFTNELAECKWSNIDESFDIMPNKFTCPSTGLSVSVNNLYECTTKLAGLEDDTINKFYFRCKDTSNNTMQESFVYNLIGTIPLKILEISPTGRITNPQLVVRTSDGALKDGSATCGYGQSSDLGSMVQFLETNSNKHVQQLTLEDGAYTFYVSCLDEAGNQATTKTTFTSFTDTAPPRIVQIYEDKSLLQSVLHITTDELSTCEYAHSQFIFGSGNTMPTDETRDHEAPWGSTVYYVICKDSYNNISPLTIIYP